MTVADWHGVASALTMIVAFVLVIGGIAQMRKEGRRRQGVLMIVAALVMVMNVVMWTVRL